MNREKGIAPIWIILFISAIFIAFLAYINFKPIFQSAGIGLDPSPKNTPTNQQAQNGDLVALEKYCMEEALKLPKPEFTYKTVSKPTRSGPMPWVNKYYPKELKESNKISCTLAYQFDGRPAYNSVAASYPTEGAKFDKIVLERFATSMNTPWKQVKGENNIYTRENIQMGTADYVDIFDGGLVIFVKFNTYYK